MANPTRRASVFALMLASVVSVCLRPRVACAVPPANDQCGGAVVIPPAGPFPYLAPTIADITDATAVGDPPIPTCQALVSRSVWYTFAPSATGNYVITTCADAPTASTVDDTVIAIYTSSTSTCGGVFIEVATAGLFDGCDDDSCITENFHSLLSTRLIAGTTYFIVVYKFDVTPPTAGNTAMQLRIDGPPSNDTCAGAVLLTLDIPVIGTTAGAADDYELLGGACFGGLNQVLSTAPGRDVVYAFTAPVAADYSMRVNGYNTTNNLVMYLAIACPGGAPPIIVGCTTAANRNTANPSEEILAFHLNGGDVAYLFVDDNAFNSGSPFRIEVTVSTQEVEPNNTPATANSIVQGIEGNITRAADVDFYSLGTPAVGSRLFAMVDGAAGTSTDFQLRLTNAVDTLEYDDDDCDLPFGGSSACIAGRPLPAVPTFLRVDHFSAVTTSGPYRVYGKVQPDMGSASAEVEPNDTLGTANVPGSGYFSGALSGAAPSTDVDLYRFCARAGELVLIGLDGDPVRDNTPINAALALLDIAGNVLVSVNDSDATSSTTSGAGSLTATTPNSPAECIAYRIGVTGTYYARVTIGTTSAGTTGAGDYLLSISGNSNCCPADCSPAPNGDGVVNVTDLLAVIGTWGACAGCPPIHCPADIAPVGPPPGDCQINVSDLLLVIGQWGACP